MALIVFTTTPPDEAESLANAIVEARLAACVQILPEIRSIYHWEGKIQLEGERLLLIKTTVERYAVLERFIKEHHSYDVPEIMAVEAERVSPAYSKWLIDSVT